MQRWQWWKQRICQRRSKTWSGFCANTGNCNSQCRNWEGALHGACHAQFPGVACFCYFRC
ncbi:defensin-like protein 19 [Pyrus communis]|uniref:defensin-like protein 19 n=1 Tax=Pyrus communis TaxID=23211 RepID=UPI0035BF3CE6